MQNAIFESFKLNLHKIKHTHAHMHRRWCDGNGPTDCNGLNFAQFSIKKMPSESEQAVHVQRMYANQPTRRYGV